MRPRTQGFTAVELLVASALALIVMLAALRLVASSRDVTQVTVDQASTVQEVQATLSLIGDDVRRSAVIHDSLTAPSWASALTGVTQALTLTMPATATCTTPQVTYAVMPRSNLTDSGVNQWLRLPPDSVNTAQSAIVRMTRCGTLLSTLTPSSRLFADYLGTVEFALARTGETTFSTSPTSATAGIPYQSVRISVVHERTVGSRTLRVPRSGTLTTVAGSRVVD